MQLSESYYRERRLEKMVENQTSFTLDQAELHVFETHQRAEEVYLKFDSTVLASMLVGKKIMHLRDEEAFEFLPGESLILPSEEVMCIDFPEAKSDTPTRCLAMSISELRINSTLDHMNEYLGKADGKLWSAMDYNFHFTNDNGIHQILSRLLYLFTEDHPSKDFFVDNMLQELIIRILQADQKKAYLAEDRAPDLNQRMQYVIDYINQHLGEKIQLKTLSEKAYLSESHFYKVFKNEMGMSPIEYINQQKLEKAADLLSNPKTSITEAYLQCGFESRSYFNRAFKKHKGISPSQFQKRFIKSKS